MDAQRGGVPDIELLENVTVLDHPLVRHKLSIMRDERTGAKEFRELVRELAMLMAYEATRDFEVVTTTVRTPIMEMETEVLAGKKVAVVPVLRAGLGMVDGILELLPAAKVGHIGMYRDEETLEPIEYYANLPTDIAERDVLVVDPMLATGGSAVAACEALVARGATNLKLLVLIAAPEGIGAVVDRIEDIKIVACAVDSHLDEHGYIVPGLGDAGDRLYGTL